MQINQKTELVVRKQKLKYSYGFKISEIVFDWISKS